MEVRLLAEPLAEDEGLEVVDVEQASQGRRRIVRVLIDKPGGVTEWRRADLAIDNRLPAVFLWQAA